MSDSQQLNIRSENVVLKQFSNNKKVNRKPRSLFGAFNYEAADIKHIKYNKGTMRSFEDEPQVNVQNMVIEQTALLKKQLTQVKDRHGNVREVSEATMKGSLEKLRVIINNGVYEPTVEGFETFIATMNAKAIAKGRKPMEEGSKATYYQLFKHWAAANGMASLPKRKFNIVDPIIMPPTDVDVQKLINAHKNPRDRCIVAFLMGTGLRRKELRSTLIRDIITDGDGTKVIVRNPKNLKERLVPILDVALPYLNTWLASRTRYLSKYNMADPGWLFITLDGTQLSAMTIYKVLDSARRKSGVNYRGAVHGGRRFCLTSYGYSGIDIGMVKDIAGHSNIETTLRYQRYNPHQKMAAAKKVRGW